MKKILLSSATVFAALVTIMVYAAPTADVAKCDDKKCGDKGEAIVTLEFPRKDGHLGRLFSVI